MGMYSAILWYAAIVVFGMTLFIARYCIPPNTSLTEIVIKSLSFKAAVVRRSSSVSALLCTANVILLMCLLIDRSLWLVVPCVAIPLMQLYAFEVYREHSKTVVYKIHRKLCGTDTSLTKINIRKPKENKGENDKRSRAIDTKFLP